MCPNCKKDTFSAWDKVKSTKPRKCSECSALVKPAFFRSAFTRSTAPAVEPLSEFKQQNQAHITKTVEYKTTQV